MLAAPRFSGGERERWRELVQLHSLDTNGVVLRVWTAADGGARLEFTPGQFLVIGDVHAKEKWAMCTATQRYTRSGMAGITVGRSSRGSTSSADMSGAMKMGRTSRETAFDIQNCACATVSTTAAMSFHGP